MAADATSSAPTVLATVNGEQLTTHDLDVELFLMKAQQGNVTTVLPPAENVLKRMIQNTLLFQEGRQLGYDTDGTIVNQVQETVRHRSVIALVDSVAFAVPEGVEDRKTEQFAAIERFIESLKTKYDVKVDTLLLKSLDYGADDPAIQAYLRDSDDVLCTSPTGAMRVSSLTRNLMFQEFHGMVGKPDADDIRDKFFAGWISEALLTYESKLRGYPERENMRMLAAYMTRDLVLQETIGLLSNVNRAPTESEIQAFYKANIDHLTPPGRLKVQSVLLEGEEPARLFKERLDQGAQMDWLADRTAEVQENVAAIPTTWLIPSMIGLEPGAGEVGMILDPMEVPGGWVVAQITEMETVEPIPLEECRDEVLRRLKAEQLSGSISDSVRRLEEAADIQTAPDAVARIAAHLEEWKRKNDAQ